MCCRCKQPQDSRSQLKHAAALQVRLMRERGFSIGNLDATIILQRPKLSPHKPAITANLCRLLGAHPSTVNIKVWCSPVGLQDRRKALTEVCGAGEDA